MILTDLSIRNRTTVAVLGVIIILLGVGAYLALPREAFPDIPIPYIFVTTTYEGVAPEDIETSVTMKIEKELTGIRGVKEVLSNSAEGLSLISVEFTPDVPTDIALQRVRDRVERKNPSSRKSTSPRSRSCTSASRAMSRRCSSRRSPMSSRIRWKPFRACSRWTCWGRWSRRFDWNSIPSVWPCTT
jgi:multidrug efflux pump subunit AcrB